MGKATRLVRSRTVTGDGEGLVSHAGLVWLDEVADRSGLTAGLSEVLAEAPRRRHDPGVDLAQLVLALIRTCLRRTPTRMILEVGALRRSGRSEPSG
jgi:hypothetical protein